MKFWCFKKVVGITVDQRGTDAHCLNHSHFPPNLSTLVTASKKNIDISTLSSDKTYFKGVLLSSFFYRNKCIMKEKGL